MRRSTVVRVVVGLAWAGLVALESRRPLEPPRERRLRHVGRNAAFAAMSAATVQALERPVVVPLATWVARRRVGLVHRLPLPGWARAVLAVVLLDYTLFVWHVLTHKAPLLWRLHAVHHADRDLDASTALRFHAAEIAASVPWRAAQVVVIGATPTVLATWQALTLASITFHHANVRLPPELDRALSTLITTPRLHRIHHGTRRDEDHANWSSGLSLWDRLHGTLRTDVDAQRVVIGLPALQRPEAATLGAMLRLPFRRRPPIALAPDRVSDVDDAAR